MPENDIDHVEALIGRAREREATLAGSTNDAMRLRVGQDRSKIVH